MNDPDPNAFATPLALASRVLVIDQFGQHGMDGLRAADAMQFSINFFLPPRSNLQYAIWNQTFWSRELRKSLKRS